METFKKKNRVVIALNRIKRSLQERLKGRPYFISLA